jgi:thymidine kinase
MNDIIKKFNEISIDFLTQSSKLVGNTYLYKFKLMTKVNSIYAIDLFIKRVLPYKNKILNKDETFFLTTSENEFDANYVEDIIGVKKIYYTLDEDSRGNIWEIVLALVCLAEERHKIKNKHHHHHISNN